MEQEKYLITFHTHYDALCCIRFLKNTELFKSNKLIVKMIPVPRSVSSSCGTAVKIQVVGMSNFSMNDLKKIEIDAFYKITENEEYKKL